MKVSDDSTASLVPAVFADRAGAEAGLRALQQAGIAAADIGVALPIREANRVQADADRDVMEGAGRGAALGVPLGVLGGIGLVTLTVGTLGVGGLFLAGAGGLLWGGTIGGLVGIVTRVRRRPDVDRWCELALDEQAVLLVVRVREWDREPEIAALLTSAGATVVEDHLDLDHAWRELELEHYSGAAAPAPSTA
jgi:hypothetical protein